MKLNRQIVILLSFLTTCFIASPVFAQDTIHIEFKFDKKPPRAGVVFAADGDQSSIEQSIVDQKDKAFDQAVYVVSPQTSLTFKNSDDMDHNIFSRGTEGIAPGFDVGLIAPSSKKTMELQWKVGAFERLGCKIHPKMRAYVASVPNEAYVAIPFKQEGLKDAYTLKVDTSTKKVGVLLPGYDPVEVDVSNQKTVEVELVKKGKKKGVIKLSRDSLIASGQ